jgi:hypothetical protein
MSTSNSDITEISPSLGVQTVINLDTVLSYERASYLAFDGSGDLWMANFEGGLYEWNPTGGTGGTPLVVSPTGGYHGEDTAYQYA